MILSFRRAACLAAAALLCLSVLGGCAGDGQPTSAPGQPAASGTTGAAPADSPLNDGRLRVFQNSVLFRGCKIKKGAVVKNCVLMQDTVVEPNCNVEYVVTDKNVHITEDKKLTGTDTFPVFVAKGHSV